MTNNEAIKEIEKLDDWISTHPSLLNDWCKTSDALDMAIKALGQTRWIPISERLPEDYIHVLCQFTLGGMVECYLAHGAFHVVGGLVMTCNEVIAWMPLPQPYKAENEDEE